MKQVLSESVSEERKRLKLLRKLHGRLSSTVLVASMLSTTLRTTNVNHRPKTWSTHSIFLQRRAHLDHPVLPQVEGFHPTFWKEPPILQTILLNTTMTHTLLKCGVCASSMQLSEPLKGLSIGCKLCPEFNPCCKAFGSLSSKTHTSTLASYMQRWILKPSSILTMNLRCLWEGCHWSRVTRCWGGKWFETRVNGCRCSRCGKMLWSLCIRIECGNLKGIVTLLRNCLGLRLTLPPQSSSTPTFEFTMLRSHSGWTTGDQHRGSAW